MLDHLAITVSDYERSREFYRKALSSLGYELMMEHDISGAGFGRDGKPDFWIQSGTPSGPIHVAFSAADRATVDQDLLAATDAAAADVDPVGRAAVDLQVAQDQVVRLVVGLDDVLAAPLPVEDEAEDRDPGRADLERAAARADGGRARRRACGAR